MTADWCVADGQWTRLSEAEHPLAGILDGDWRARLWTAGYSPSLDDGDYVAVHGPARDTAVTQRWPYVIEISLDHDRISYVFCRALPDALAVLAMASPWGTCRTVVDLADAITDRLRGAE